LRTLGTDELLGGRDDGVDHHRRLSLERKDQVCIDVLVSA
jgi:hypothetical protein